MNVRESEAAARALLDAGHTEAADEASADIVIVNTCSVRGKAEDKAIGKLGLLCASKRERPARIIGLMGCMAQRMGKDIFKKLPLLDFSIGTRCADSVAPAVEAAAALPGPESVVGLGVGNLLLAGGNQSVYTLFKLRAAGDGNGALLHEGAAAENLPGHAGEHLTAV